VIEKLADFKKLRTREKTLLIGLAVAVGFSLYFQVMYKPLSRKITRYKFQIEKSKSRLGELETKFPQIENQRRNIHSLDVECNLLLDKISEVEKALPSKKSAAQLLSELTKQAKGLKMYSIRQKMDSGDEYSRIFIELKFNAPYENTINYIRKVESVSPFLAIEELDISEPKGRKEAGGTPTKLVLSSLMGETPTAELFKAEEQKEALEVSRDIFVSKSRPVSTIRKAELKLQGITYNPEGSTAIVNGDVVRVGSEVGSLQVKEIRPEEVILTDGTEDHILLIER